MRPWCLPATCENASEGGAPRSALGSGSAPMRGNQGMQKVTIEVMLLTLPRSRTLLLDPARVEPSAKDPSRNAPWPFLGGGAPAKSPDLPERPFCSMETSLARRRPMFAPRILFKILQRSAFPPFVYFDLQWRRRRRLWRRRRDHKTWKKRWRMQSKLCGRLVPGGCPDPPAFLPSSSLSFPTSLLPLPSSLLSPSF
jgi:hypothetical protein